MKTYCEECHALVGDVRDASIRRNTTYVCGNCNGKNYIDKPKQNKYAGDGAIETLRRMFGMR